MFHYHRFVNYPAWQCYLEDLETPGDANSHIWLGSTPPEKYFGSSVVYRTCMNESYVLVGEQSQMFTIRCEVGGGWIDVEEKICMRMYSYHYHQKFFHASCRITLG